MGKVMQGRGVWFCGDGECKNKGENVHALFIQSLFRALFRPLFGSVRGVELATYIYMSDFRQHGKPYQRSYCYSHFPLHHRYYYLLRHACLAFLPLSHMSKASGRSRDSIMPSISSSSFPSSTTAKKYEPLLGSTHVEDGEARTSSEYDDAGDLPHGRQRRREGRRVRLLLSLNVFQAVATLVFFLLWWRERLQAIPTPPYSPAYEAVRYTTKLFARNETFHGENETAPELDDAWEYIVGRELQFMAYS